MIARCGPGQRRRRRWRGECDDGRRHRRAAVRAAGLSLAGLVLIAAVEAQADPLHGGYGLVPSEDALREQVREPLFAFVLMMTERDSLGSWTARDLQDFAASWGRDSVFPLARHITSLTRKIVPAGQRQRLGGAECARRWVVDVHPRWIDLPMPFSILGYRPGKLSFHGPLHLDEWRLGERRLHLASPEGARAWDVSGATIYRVVSGWLIMDVHEWLDRLLGSLLEDAVMEGFIVALADGQLIGIGNSAGRRGRRLFGEMDFRTGRIETAGRPLALALSRHGRAWTRPPEFDLRAVWEAYRR